MIEKIKKLLDDGKLEEGLVLLNEKLEEDLYNIELLQIKGTLLRNLKDYSGSIAIFDSLVNLLPRDAEIYAERGLSYHSASQKDAAISDFTKAITLEPENAYRYASRAFIKNFYGDHAGALDDYNKALALDPDDAISLNNKGMIEENLGREKDAIKSFMAADKVSGVDQKLAKIKTEKPPHHHAPQLSKKRNTIWNQFLLTLKGIFSSGAERKSFLKFLGKK